MKSISTINPAITENTECQTIEVCTSIIDLEEGVSFDHDVLYHYASFHFYVAYVGQHSKQRMT